MITQSPTIGELAKALAKAQGAMTSAKKSAVNPHFKSKYADLAEVIDSIRKPLSDNSIAFTQLNTTDENGNVSVTTMLMHESGEFIGSTFSAKPQQVTVQGYGSTITYLRRYSAMAIAGLASDDDDGEAATSRTPMPQSSLPAGARDVQTAAARTAKTFGGSASNVEHASWSVDKAPFIELLGDAGINYDHLAGMCEKMGRARPSQMDTATRGKLVDWLRTPAGSAAITDYVNAVENGN
jgi:hypothetical protein